MRMIICILMLAVTAFPLRAQFSSGGLQDGGHGSGGDEKADYITAVNAGWNIVSVPIAVGDYLASAIYPTAVSPAYSYGNGYTEEDTLENGPGYWLKFPGAQSQSLNGALIEVDTVAVDSGWNIVGSISSPILSASVVPLGTTLQSGFYSFDAGYQLAPTIEPGKGYWVKAGTPGFLVFSSAAPPVAPQKNAEDHLRTLSLLTVTDASGAVRTLYFGQLKEEASGLFELPPVPPAGIFDARFAGQSMAAGKDEAIVLSSAVYPVEVRWELASAGEYLLVVDGKETRLAGNGSMTVSRVPSRLFLKVGAPQELPKEYALEQNYPNPFNPTTTIRYSLPSDARVSLRIYNLYGQEIRTLLDEAQEAGFRSVEWDGRNNAGAGVASGVYFYRLEAGPFLQARKMLLLR